MSCFDRVKMGFMVGFAVGMSAAGLFGTYAALRSVLLNEFTWLVDRISNRIQQKALEQFIWGSGLGYNE